MHLASLGSRQAVRHSTLTAAFVSSNLASPATKNGCRLAWCPFLYTLKKQEIRTGRFCKAKRRPSGGRSASPRACRAKRRANLASPANKKTPFVYQTKGVFLNDVFRCAERDGVMRPSDVMCASRVKVTLAEHITSLCGEAAKHHCEHSEQHHLLVRANITSSLGNRQQSEAEGFFA